jgi:translocation protein SEC63
MEKIKKRADKYRYTWLNWSFVVKLIFLAVLWYWLYECFVVVKDIEPLKTFIPHELLGVEPDATKGQIKKAYRKLSREKHPDKNPDNPQAVNEFIQITKAYTILTDEKARENFLKYGNPDGKGSFAVGIALPRFL